MCMTRMSPELWDQIPAETQVIFLEMAETIQRLEARVAELERQLGMTPQNSSLPPSSQHPHTKPAAKAKPSGKKPGGQPGHKKAERALVPADQVDETITLKPKTCRRCGERLSGNDSDPLRHQVWELPEIKPTITEYQRHRLECLCCGASTAAELPEGVPAGKSGPHLVAFVTLLMAYFRQSKRRTALFVESILNIPCSPGLTVKHQTLATDALASCYDELTAALPKQTATNMDETASKQSRQKAWLWVAVTPVFTLFALRLTRAATVVKELLGETYEGVITCDRYAGYNGYQRQFCWAHLKRDFQAMIDCGGKAKQVGTRLMDVTHELFRHWQRYRDGTIQWTTMKRNVHRLKYDVWEALEDGMRCRHESTAGTCTHLFDHFDHLWTFLDHPNVEPTNNAAERALRHAVIWRKLSFGTQSAGGSRFMETMLSVIETCRQQDRDVFSFVTNAIDAHFDNRTTPSLLSGA